MNSHRWASVTALVLTLACGAAAAGSATHVGTWQGSIQTSRGDVATVLALGDTAGTWRMMPLAVLRRENACMGKDLPVSVITRTEAELVLKVRGGELLAGCITSTLTVRIQGNSMSGAFVDGANVKFTRR